MCNYQLDELLLAAICAVISGAESWTLVVEWSEMKLDWLRQQLPFANGIASHDTFGRVFSLLDAKQFEACFMLWIGELCPSLAWGASSPSTPWAASTASPPKSSRGTDYVLGVKDNQPGLAEAVNHTPARWIGPSRTTSRSKRITGGSKPRRCLATNDVAWLQEQHQHWTGLRSLVMIESTREIIGKKRRRHG